MKKIITIITMLALVFTLAAPMTAEAKATPKLNKTKLTLTITQKKKNLTYKLKVKNTSKKIKWKTSNKKVATVNRNGKITAKKKGKTVITAKVGKRRLRCKVTVKDIRKVKTSIKVPVKTPGPISTKKPVKTSIPKPTKKPVETPNTETTPVSECEHEYEDHWATFEEYYENSSGSVRIYFCNCGLFLNADSCKQHLVQKSTCNETRSDNEKLMGLHGSSAKGVFEVQLINDKPYLVVKTKYIDKRTCIKCGQTLESTWDMPEEPESSSFPIGLAIPDNPYPSGKPASSEESETLPPGTEMVALPLGTEMVTLPPEAEIASPFIENKTWAPFETPKPEFVAPDSPKVESGASVS